MILKIISSGYFRRAARIVLAALVLIATSAPLFHVHAAHACPPGTHSSAATGEAADRDHLHAGDQSREAPDHKAGGFDCCLHHSPPLSPYAGAPLIARYDLASARIAIPQDAVLDATPASRLERPPRHLLST